MTGVCPIGTRGTIKKIHASVVWCAGKCKLMVSVMLMWKRNARTLLSRISQLVFVVGTTFPNHSGRP